MRTHESIELLLPGGEAVRGDLHFTGTPGQRAVLFVHGFGSHRGGEKALALEAACARRGWTFAACDFRGHGESGGLMRHLRGSRMMQDLAAVRDHLATRGVRRLGLVGSSMGGWASAWFALRQPDAVDACVFVAPAFRFLQRRWEGLTEEQRAAWRQAGFVRYKNEWVDVEVGYGLVAEHDQFPPEWLADRWSKPLLIFHGLADDIVPAADTLAFMERSTHPDTELRLFKTNDHRLNAFKDEIAEEACRFFARSATWA